MPKLNNLKKALTAQTHCHWGGITKGFDALLIGNIFQAFDHKRPLIIVCHDEKELGATQQFLNFFHPSLSSEQFLPWDCAPYDRVSPSRYISAGRLTTLANMRNNKSLPPVVLTTARTFLDRLPPKKLLDSNSLVLEKGKTYTRQLLLETLTQRGYIRTDVVREPGEFAIRGALVDMFPATLDQPVRLDFFDTTLESIKQFDPLTQRSEKPLTSFDVISSSEIISSQSSRNHFKHQYRQHFGFEATKDFLYEAVDKGHPVPGIEHWLGFFYQATDHLLDYTSDPLVIFTHNFNETLINYYEHIKEQYQARLHALEHKLYEDNTWQYRPIPLHYQFFEPTAVQKKLSACQQVHFSPFTPPNEQLHFDSGLLPTRPNHKTKTIHHLNELQAQKQKPIYFVYQNQNLLAQQNHSSTTTSYKILPHWLPQKKPDLYCINSGLPHGFMCHDFLLYTENDLCDTQRLHKKPRKTFKEITNELMGYQPGDLIVHRDHGIGRFCALTPITVNHMTHDCVALAFANDDKLFVPVENLDVLTKYAGNHAEVVLDKLGHSAWQKRKAQVKKRLFDIAEKLLHTAAKRTLNKGIAIPYDEKKYRAFSETFPYDVTDDQHNAIEDVIEDLTADQPMDRLICGDVGFGKTEVAMRAAFLTALAGYQVVILTPTTILAQQHTKSFQNRFQQTNLKIAQLSRLVSPKQATQTKQAFANGEINILIATHTALTRSLVCTQLGLVVIDEEQHFGVNQKEKLKKQYPKVNMLTLTATPIPRTLQMALHGIREMSLIATPPMDRLAIRSFVTPFDLVMIKEAVLREYHRGGQIYFVCPRIADLKKIEKKLHTFIPEVSMATAHGQMPPKELQKVMEGFAAGTFQMLLATNIIESGLDIPAANTLFVYNADLFGLSQLYQIRGRIGRGKQRAYAYFLLPERRQPNDKAQKRLEIMQTLEGLGAGFALASHDMDIRGAGNLVGDAQSGHIKEVGIELYQQMLEETVSALKLQQGQQHTLQPEWSPQINLQIPVFIPETYIPDISLRMGLYRRISELRTDEKITFFQEEMLDRFGPLPEALINLLSVVRLKNICRAAYIEKIDVGSKGALLTFYNNSFPKPEQLVSFLQSHQGLLKLRSDQKLLIMRTWASPTETMEGLHGVLSKMATTCLSGKPPPFTHSPASNNCG